MYDQLDQQLQQLMHEVRQRTLTRMQENYDVSMKTSFKDLVTTVDKENEQFIDDRLRQLAPQARIVSEEGFGDQVKDMQGEVFIVDPIDGTMNFVMQHTNFAIMIGFYVDGKPVYGYIMDVMANKLYHGGNGKGVFVNDQRLHAPADNGLHDSLVVLNSGLVLNGGHNLREAAMQARGLRMYGSAGIEMIYAITGKVGGYLSYLKPWDLAAGKVLAEELGLVVKAIDGQAINVLSSNLVLVATRQVAEDILAIVD